VKVGTRIIYHFGNQRLPGVVCTHKEIYSAHGLQTTTPPPPAQIPIRLDQPHHSPTQHHWHCTPNNIVPVFQVRIEGNELILEELDDTQTV
jgi:hypothetical protein